MLKKLLININLKLNSQTCKTKSCIFIRPPVYAFKINLYMYVCTYTQNSIQLPYLSLYCLYSEKYSKHKLILCNFLFFSKLHRYFWGNASTTKFLWKLCTICLSLTPAASKYSIFDYLKRGGVSLKCMLEWDECHEKNQKVEMMKIIKPSWRNVIMKKCSSLYFRTFTPFVIYAERRKKKFQLILSGTSANILSAVQRETKQKWRENGLGRKILIWLIRVWSAPRFHLSVAHLHTLKISYYRCWYERWWTNLLCGSKTRQAVCNMR